MLTVVLVIAVILAVLAWWLSAVLREAEMVILREAVTVLRDIRNLEMEQARLLNERRSA